MMGRAPLSRQRLEAFLDELLAPSEIQDYCPQGLQVEGAETITRMAFGVSASQALFVRAIEAGVQAILVHHGLFWKGDERPVVGPLRRRLGLLIEANVSLFAYHLSLDLHPVVGNNARFADLLDLTDRRPFGTYQGHAIGVRGRLRAPRPLATFAADVDELLDVPGPLVLLEGGPQDVQEVAIVTGRAPGLLREAATAGVDVFITGEASEPAWADARELGVSMLAVGHYRSERLGPLALEAELRERFGLETLFLDVDNPV